MILKKIKVFLLFKKHNFLKKNIHIILLQEAFIIMNILELIIIIQIDSIDN